MSNVVIIRSAAVVTDGSQKGSIESVMKQSARSVTTDERRGCDWYALNQP